MRLRTRQLNTANGDLREKPVQPYPQLNFTPKHIERFYLSNAPEEMTYIGGVTIELFSLGGEACQKLTPILWNCIDSFSGFLRTGMMLFNNDTHHVKEKYIKMLAMVLSDAKQFYCTAINQEALNNLFHTTYLPGIPISFVLTTLIDFVVSINEMIRAINKASSFEEWLKDSIDELSHLRKNNNKPATQKRIDELTDDIKALIRVNSRENPQQARSLIEKYTRASEFILEVGKPLNENDLERQECIRKKLDDSASESILNCVVKGCSFVGQTMLALATVGVSVAGLATIGWALACVAAVHYLNNNILYHGTGKKSHQLLGSIGSSVCGFFAKEKDGDNISHPHALAHRMT